MARPPRPPVPPPGTTDLANMGRDMTQMMDFMRDSGRIAHNTALRKAAIKVFSRIIKMTPVMTGRARASWYVDTLKHNDTRDDNPVSPELYVQDALPQFIDAPVYLFNNVPYIEDIEYGGYPQNPVLGTLMPGGYYEIRSRNKFSKQAPQGMMRIGLNDWGDVLREQIAIEMSKIR